ncbi:VCBS repeat-containing protein, partial [Sphingomonas sp. F9_3S_D5_B_2]
TQTETFTVTVTDDQGATATQDVTVTINGTNDGPVITSSAQSGSVTEDTALTASGQVTSSDVDHNATAAYSGNTTGTYGSFAVDPSSGAWTYTLDNANHQDLAAGETQTETFTVTVTDDQGATATQDVTVTINGTNDAAVLSAGVANLTEGNTAAAISTSGTLTISDVDSPATFVAQSGTAGAYGHFSVGANGAWTYTADTAHNEFAAGTTYTDTFTVTAADGTTTSVTVNIAGTNDAAVLSAGVANLTEGNTAAAISTSGTLTISDVDSAATFVAQSGTAGTYGHFSVGTNGAWTYTADSAHNEFAAGTTYTDTFTVTSADGTTTTVTVNIAGTNDAAVISGTTAGTVVEAGGVANGTPGTPTATGTLTDTDVDNTANSFNAVAAGTAIYGSFTMTAGGVWTYTLNNGNSSVQGLNAGQTLTDTFTVTTIDGTQQTISVTINGTNDAAVITGTKSGSVIEAGGVANGTPGTPTATGTLTDTDVDNAANSFNAVAAGTATYGSFTMTAGGVWTYTLNNGNSSVQGLNVGQTLTDGFTVTSADGTAQTITVTINGTNDAAVISGTTTGSVVEAGGVSNGSPGTPTATGTLTDTDVDNASNSFTAVAAGTASTGGYGTFAMTSGGVWTYSVNNSNATVQALNAGGTLTDTFTVHTTDGTAQVVTVTINGTDDAPVVDVNGANTYTTGGSAVAIDSSIPISDLDNTQLQGATVQITGGRQSGDVLNFTNQSGITGTYNGATGLLTLSGNATLANYQAALQSITFSSTSTSTAQRTVSFQATDTGGAASAADTATVDVVGGDTTPPTVTLTATPANAPTGSVVTVTLQFSEAVTGFTLSDLAVTAGTVVPNSFHQVDADTYTVQYTRTANGNNPMTVTLSGAYTDLALNAGSGGSLEIRRDAPAGAAGEPMNMALHAPEGALVTVHIAELPDGWSVDGAVQLPDHSWIVGTSDVGSLTVTTPSDYVGAELLDMTMTWTNADGTSSTVVVANNVEAYLPGSPIFAWSGDDTLTGSSGTDEFVFAQPIGIDVVHSFDVSADKIDLIGYGLSSFAEVQAHLSENPDGSAVITLANGQSITLEGVSGSSLTSSNFEFDATPTVRNAGTITIGNGALLPLSGNIENSGIINLVSTGAATVLELIQNGITLQGGGEVLLSDNAGNVITASLPSVSFTNVDNTISGAGSIGGGSLTLVNEGIINATGTNALVIDTGDNCVVNSGTLESTASGGLQVVGDLQNDGLVLAGAGSVTIGGDVTGLGQFEIDGTALVEFGGHSTNAVLLDGAATGVVVFDHASDFTGSISGLNSDDRLDLRDVQFGETTSLNYVADGAGGGVLTVSDGVHSAQLHLVGEYQPSDFHLGSDGLGGTFVTNGLLA